MLSPLQREIATVIAGVPEAEDFALAGGAALIVHGAVARVTRDLDCFGPDPRAVDRLALAAQRALRSEGFTVERLLDHPGFVRFLVGSEDDRTEVDLGSDARLFPVDRSTGYPLLSTEELAVDKVLACSAERRPVTSWTSWRCRIDSASAGFSRQRAIPGILPIWRR